MLLLLLALLLVETLSGLYINNDIADEGPLSGLGISMLPFWESQTFTSAFLPAGAGPWKCAIVA